MSKSKSSHSLAITTTLRRCCPTEVPDELLSLLDGQSASREALQQCLSYQEQLCPLHLKLFAKRTAVFLSNTIFSLEAKDQITADHPEPIPIRRRRSLSDISQYAPPAKRHRPDSPYPSTAAQEGGRAYPRNTYRNEAYRSQIISELSQKLAQNRTIQGSHGEQTDRLMLKILRKAKQPNTDEKNGPIEAHFLAGEEAAAVVESRSDDVPIFTHNQQSFQWTDRERPIAQFFQRIGDLNRSVSVQMPSRPSDKDSFEKRTLREIRGRFLGREPTDDPWNILDLRSPLPPGVLLPRFLMGPNCQLHLGIRDALLMADSAERITASVEERRMWRDDQEMALLSEGSHNTAPHTDSDGKATWLTVQEGLYLVVWMSNPTPEQWNAWIADPARYAGGQWRYEVLWPGQTVFFRPGAVHGISRRQQTLVLAGHVLLWSDVVRWMEVFKVQMRNPHITNEDMGSSAYLVKAVKRLVSSRVRDGKVEQLGGQEALDRFFALVEEFEQEQKEFEKDRKMDQKELEKKLKELKKEVEKKQKELDKMQEELQKLSQSNRKDGN